jgi:hypothetical protein
MADQGISNRRTPEQEAQERDEFPPADPNMRKHIDRIDEPQGRDSEDEEEFEESDGDDEAIDEEESVEDYS